MEGRRLGTLERRSVLMRSLRIGAMKRRDGLLIPLFSLRHLSSLLAYRCSTYSCRNDLSDDRRARSHRARSRTTQPFDGIEPAAYSSPQLSRSILSSTRRPGDVRYTLYKQDHPRSQHDAQPRLSRNKDRPSNPVQPTPFPPAFFPSNGHDLVPPRESPQAVPRRGRDLFAPGYGR